MRSLIFGLGLLCLTMSVSAQQVAKGVTASNGEFIGFLEYKPVNYNASKKYPLIIFLHGIGERGNGTTELQYVASNAIPRYIKNGHTMTFTYNGQEETFLVLSPQLNKKYGNWQNFYVDEMLKHATQNLSVDPDRIYLTGLSLGGGGTWRWSTSSAANASKLAAIAPVCGTHETVDVCNLTNNNVGVWAFHAMDDNVVGVGATQNSQMKIGYCNPTYPAIFTYYPNGGHGIWDRSYSTDNSIHTPNIYQWFLSRKRNSGAVQYPVANAGNDININWPVNSANLSGAASYDPDGTIVTYTWSQVSGPNTASIASAASQNTVINNLVPGTYTFKLEVRDNTNLTASDNVVVTVTNTNTNIAPVASAGSDFDMTLPMDSLLVDAYRSSDIDGTIAAYRWSLLSGPGTVTIATPNSMRTWLKKMSTPGVYSYLLEVTDNLGAKGRDTIHLTIKSNTNLGTVTVNAGADATITLPAASVQLNGWASTTAGTINSYTWSKVSGPASFAFSNANAASTAVSQLAQGIYVFQLLAKNSNGISNTATVKVTVNAAPVNNNAAPVANAGKDFDLVLPLDSVYIDAYLSADSDGWINAFKWSQINGPSAATIVQPNSKYSWFKKMNTPGVYSFLLEVTDDKGAIGKDTLNITVKAGANLGTVSVNAGTDINITMPVTSAQLNGWASTTVGSIVSYKWTKISGPASFSFANAASASTLVSQLTQGIYIFELESKNSNGVAATASVKVTVNAAPPDNNAAPVANAGSDFEMKLPLDSVYLDAYLSNDPDGWITAFKWSQINGPSTATIVQPNSKYSWFKRMNVAGVYTYLLEVTDNKGAIGKDTLKITITSSNNPATGNVYVSAGTDGAIQLPTSSISLNGNASSENGAIVSYLWTKLSGPANCTITNPNDKVTTVNQLVVQGDYIFKLEAKDNVGKMASSTVKIAVIANTSANKAPIAWAGSDFDMTLPMDSLFVDGFRSQDYDGYIVSYKWKQIGGPSTVIMPTPNNVGTWLKRMNVPGNYVYSLEVVDNSGASNIDTLTITIKPAIPNNTRELANEEVKGNNTTLATGSTVNNQAVSDAKTIIPSENIILGSGIFPNPARSVVNLQYQQTEPGLIKITIYDLQGKAVKVLSAIGNGSTLRQSINIEGLNNGTYFLEVLSSTKNTKREVFKFIKF